jgi:hypothetical protein
MPSATDAVRIRVDGLQRLARAAAIVALFVLCGVVAPTSSIRADDKATDAKTEIITGKVVDKNGKPVAGARVTLHRWESPTRRWGKWRVAKADVRSDDTGTFQIPDVKHDYYKLSFDAPGFARGFRDVSLSDEEPPREFTMTLKPPVSPTIQIVDESGKPVQGARVREFRQRGVNGPLRMSQLSLDTLG